MAGFKPTRLVLDGGGVEYLDRRHMIDPRELRVRGMNRDQ